MKLFDWPNKRTHGIFTITLKVIFFLLLFIIPIFLYMINATSILFIFIVLIALYPIFKLINGYQLLNSLLHENKMNLIPFLAIFFTFINVLSSIFLWLGSNPSFINISLRQFNYFTGYLTPYLIVFTILRVCKSLDTQFPFTKPRRLFLFSMALFMFQLFSNMIYLFHYI